MGYRDDLQNARKKLLELQKQRNAIDQQMRGYAQIIQSLEFLENQEQAESIITALPDLETMGLTNAVRTVLQAHPNGSFTPVGLRQVLVESGVTDSKNLLVNIHTVLRRLKTTGEVSEIESAGEKGYQWVSGLTRLLNQEAAAFGREGLRAALKATAAKEQK
jgi:hypothetical protein